MIKLLTYDVYKSGMHRFKELADETYQDKEHLPKYYLRRVASSYVPVGYDEAYRLVYEISGDSETHYAGNDVIGIKGSSGGGIILSYIVSGSTPFSSDWLTDNPGDPAFTPNDDFLYLIVSPGNMYNCIYRFITTSVEDEHVIGSYVKVSESRGDGAILAYEVYGKTPFASDWLSGESSGLPLEPKDGLLYLVISQGKYYNMLFRYDASANSGAGAYTMLSSKGSGIIFVYENSSGTEFGPDWFEESDHTVITPEEGQVYLDLTPGDFENNMFRFDSSLGQAGQYVSVSGGSGGGAIMSYIVSGSTALSPGWLSKTAGGEALRPNDGSLYLILSAGQYYSFLYRFDSSIGQDGQYVLVGNSRIVELTETEYINLEQHGLIDNGIIYLITDGAPSAPTGNDFIPALSVIPQNPYNGQIILWKGVVGGDFTVQNAFYYYESSSAHWFKSNLGIDAQVIQVNSLPSPSAQEKGKVYQYIGTSTNDLVHNYFYECTGSTGDYSWTNVKVQGSDKFQYDTMPVASADWIGKVIQYIGVTGNDYTHNYFYECVEDAGSYLWELVRVESEETKEMLFDDWDLLSQSEKDNGQAYFIPDVHFASDYLIKTGFTPVGSVIYVTGLRAPKFYLICDGTSYNIADYPELAEYFTAQFGQSNYFGGDGITTFAVPDLRNSIDSNFMILCIAYKDIVIESRKSASGGLLPRLLISARAGSDIYCSKGGVIITASEITEGNFRCDVPDFGTWEISCLDDGTEYFRMACDVTAVKIYNIVAELDSVPAWLYIGGVNKSYTILSQVLADSAALATLMASEDAVNYMVLCTDWILDICSNESAMTQIGLNNYCAETLLADDLWKQEIVNSDYIEKVYNVSVPKLTSNSSKVFYTGNLYGNSYDPWKVFDRTNTSVYDGVLWSGNNQGVASVGYQFDSPVNITVVMLQNKAGGDSEAHSIKDFSIQGSNNNISWVTLGSFTNVSASSLYSAKYELDNSSSYLYYRLFVVTAYATNYQGIGNLQFYGRV